MSNPELVLIPTVHNIEVTKIEYIPYILLNLSEEAIFLRKGEILRHLEKEDITIEEITTETMLQCKDIESEKLNCGDSVKKAFIASPVSGDTCKKVRLQDVEALSHRKMTIEKVTTEAVSQCKDMESEKLNCGDELKKTFIVSPVNVDTCEKVKQQDVETLSYQNISVEEITTEPMLQSEGMEMKKPRCDILSKKMFIASPAEIDACQKVKLQKAEVLNINENEYKETMLQSEGMEIKKPRCDILSKKEFIASPAEIDTCKKVKLQKAEVLNINENEYKETMLQGEGMENEKPRCDMLSEKKFITSPADVDTHRKVKLQDAEVLDKYKIEYKKLCEEYNDIFSKDSSDIGKTPLITMEIETGDSPPVCQRPYNLPLKHIDWVQKELNMLEKAGIITRSVSPWASPIVIVPKRMAPGEPPKKRLCVDYRVINSLLSKINKAHSKAKGVLTLVPLPKIDGIYARLKGSKVYSGFDA